MLAELSGPLVGSTVSGKSANMRRLAASYCASRSSRVNFLSFITLASKGEVAPSSLLLSPPSSEVVFDGAEELAGVPMFAEVLPEFGPARLMILKPATAGVGADWAVCAANTLRGGGLLMSVVAK